MASEEYKESDLSKIVKRLMDEEGFEFGEAVREAMEQTKNFESKADGGSIGIEVLFTDKMANGGRVPMVSGGALKTVGSGIMKLFSKGDDVVDLAKQEEIFRSGDITTDFLENVDDKVIKKFITTRDTKGPGGYGMYDSFDDMPNGLKAAELISRIKTADGGINYEAAELFIGKKLKGDETVNELIKLVIKKPGLTDSPLKDFENYVLKSENLADGGRVGLFMGGDPLTGQALQTYNSMKAYGFSDQEIADALSLQRASASSAEPAAATAAPINIYNQIGGGGNGPDDDDDDGPTSNAGLKGFDAVRSAGLFALNPVGFLAAKAVKGLYDNYKNPYTNIMGGLNKGTRDAIDAQGRDSAPGRGDAGNPGGSSGAMDDSNAGSFCFDPKTLIQMADGSTKEIKNIQLGDDTKGGEVTGVFQFKATDEIHDYKGVTVAGSHYVKEDGKFIMVKDSPLAVKIDKIPVVYSLDTTGRRIFINNIEFADYNGDGVAKNFLTNAGVDLSGFDKEVLRQVENRLI